MRNEDGNKWLTASRLIELLAKLPPDSRVMPNTVGNLLVTDDQRPIAYIDFIGDGEIENMD